MVSSKKAWLLAVSLALGLEAFLFIKHLVPLRASERVIGKCYTHKNEKFGLDFFEKVIGIMPNKKEVVVVYTFVGPEFKEFKGHWATLKGLGPEKIEIGLFFDRMKETKCPW